MIDYDNNYLYEKCKELLLKRGFDIDIESYPKLGDRIRSFIDYEKEKSVVSETKFENDLIELFTYIQNCGGYALQLPICIFSDTRVSFEENVLRILELYPFVRLLGDTELKEEEYIVAYRSGKKGHHFIRIGNNGKAIDKESAELPKLFNGWGSLHNDYEAIFAVIKQEYRTEEMKRLPQCNTSMRLSENAEYVTYSDGYKTIETNKAQKSETFEDLIIKAHNENLNSIKYLGKTFTLNKNKIDKDIIDIFNDQKIIGKFYINDDGFIIDFDDEKKKYAFGYQPTKPILIKNKIKEKNEDDFEI